MKFTIGKIAGFVVLSAITLFAGLIFSVALAFSDSTLFYAKTLLPFLVFFLLILALWFFSIFTPKTRIVILIVSLICSAVLAIANGLYFDQLKRIERISSTEVELSQYRPFVSTSRIARLGHPPSWKLAGQLPKIDGATALYPLYASFVEATFPEADYSTGNSPVQCTTTANAYERLISGDVDIIFCAQPSREQKKAAQDSGVELVLTPIGREAFIFFVNANNKVDGLSSQEIKDIYRGKIRMWSQVGGSFDFIRAYQRPVGSGSQTMFLKIMAPDLPQAPDTEDVAEGMGGIVTRVSEYRNFESSIGFSFLYYMTQMVDDKKVKLISIDGVSPTPESIRSEQYPFSAKFYAVTTGRSVAVVKPFISWILSKEGQELVEKTGYVSLQKAENLWDY